MIGRTVRTVAGLNPDLRTLFATTLAFRAGTMAYPFLSAYLLLPGRLSTGRISLVVSAFGVGALCADLAAGLVLGRVGARTTMMCGLTAQAAVLAVTPLLRDTPALLPAVLLWGFAYELFTPASYSATVARSTPEERKIAFSCNRLAINLGMGIGPAIGGFVFVVSPTALFWINAAFVLTAAGVLANGTSPGTDRGNPVPAVAGPGGPQTAATAGERAAPGHRLISATVPEETRFWTAFCLSLPIQLAFSLPAVFTSIYVIVVLGLPSYWVGLLLTVNAVAIVLFELPLNTATAHWGHLRSLLVGYGLTGAGFLLMGFAESGPSLIAATLLWTAGEMVVFPALLTYVSAISEPAMSDRNMSFFSAGVNLAFIAAPQVSLLLSGPPHQALPWFVAGAAVLVAFLLMLAARTSAYTWLPAPQPATVPEPSWRTE